VVVVVAGVFAFRRRLAVAGMTAEQNCTALSGKPSMPITG
jgi:hypothetical protein